MTLHEKVILSAYTGILMCNMSLKFISTLKSSLVGRFGPTSCPVKFCGKKSRKKQNQIFSKSLKIKENHMDCKNCVSALVCKDAQDSSYREKIREGEISCCDFYPRPDDSLKKAIAAVAKLDSTSGVPQSVYVAEECSELVKELMKKERRKGNNFAIIDEACDVLTTVFIMLYQYGVTEWTIQQNILAKCKRALERYEKFGEL